MERPHYGAVVVQIGVRASEIAQRIGAARQTIHAPVIRCGARAVSVPVGTAGRISENPKVIVKRMVLLHHDDDVIDLPKVDILSESRGGEKTKQDNCGQTNLAVHDAPMGLNFEGRALVSKAYQTSPARQ